jgi:hypothetical protein
LYTKFLRTSARRVPRIAVFAAKTAAAIDLQHRDAAGASLQIASSSIAGSRSISRRATASDCQSSRRLTGERR